MIVKVILLLSVILISHKKVATAANDFSYDDLFVTSEDPISRSADVDNESIDYGILNIGGGKDIPNGSTEKTVIQVQNTPRTINFTGEWESPEVNFFRLSENFLKLN